MKISEFNQPKKLNEGLLDVLVGPDLGGKLRKGDARHRDALNVFLKDFIGDASTSLENGIESGLIDPSIASSSAAPATKPSPAGATPTSPAAPTGGAPTIPPAKRASGPTSAQATMAAARQFNKGVTKAQSAKADVRASNEKLKKDAEIAAAKPAFQQDATDRVNIQKARAAGLISENYSRLNYIFESILSELDAGDSPMSISDYMTEWFDMYMNGVDWKAKQSIVLPKIKEIEKTYKTDGGRAAIQTLGRLAFALSGPAGAVPAGAKNIPAVAAAAPTATKKSKEQVASDLASLKPREREEVIQQVQKATK